MSPESSGPESRGTEASGTDSSGFGRRPPDSIELRGLRALGTHGVLPEEHHRAQPFEVDLDLEVDLRPAGRSDTLTDTVDYGAVTAAVAAVVSGAHTDLLEQLAERIATVALTTGAPHATAVTVRVRKTRPPVPFELGSAGVTIHRRRDDVVA